MATISRAALLRADALDHGEPVHIVDREHEAYARVVALHGDVQVLRRDAHAAHYLPAPTLEV